MIQQTSLNAYSKIQPELGERQRQVFKALSKLGIANNLMIAHYTGMQINQVTPRILELRNLGLVMMVDTLPCPYTKRKTLFWRVKKC